MFHIHTHAHFSVCGTRSGGDDLWVTGDGFDHVVGSRRKVKDHLSGSAESRSGRLSGDHLKCQLQSKTSTQTGLAHGRLDVQ